ncbi:ribosomal protein S2, flavodoxin-like domain-containing protein [Mycena olivaceomarginata]|nr:ribosomal protein S2, flavodoxin-like domain-containing protein [Mycena olivaceomarginata]
MFKKRARAISVSSDEVVEVSPPPSPAIPAAKLRKADNNSMSAGLLASVDLREEEEAATWRHHESTSWTSAGPGGNSFCFAARIIAAVENPNDICVISVRPYGHRAVPRLIAITDPGSTTQAIREAFYANISVIVLCDTDAPLKFAHVGIPTNNKTRHSIGLVWWLEVPRLRGAIPRSSDGWSVMVDRFFYRDPEEATEWDVRGGPQEGVSPGLVCDGGALNCAADPTPGGTSADWAAEPAGWCLRRWCYWWSMGVDAGIRVGAHIMRQ